MLKLDKGALPTVVGARIVETPEALVAIRRPDCSAAIWQRAPLSSFQTWIDGLAPEVLPRARIILRPVFVRDAVQSIFNSAGTPPGEERTRLIDDISAMSEIFAGLMQAPFLRLRLDVVSTNACRKFHVDYLTARLVCTYRGTGTQFATLENGQDPETIATVPTGSPIVLRGTQWPAQFDTGLRHRSPPIAGTGETRLVLVLDPISDHEAEASAKDRPRIH